MDGVMASQDRIEIRDLRVRAIVGVHEEERIHPQDVLVSLMLYGDQRAAGASDALADTTDYDALARTVTAHVQHAHRFTLEALAGDIARLCLHAPGVQRVRVRVEKPEALRAARTVAVEIEREAADFQ
jgi:FolB domain-containing protein